MLKILTKKLISLLLFVLLLNIELKAQMKRKVKSIITGQVNFPGQLGSYILRLIHNKRIILHISLSVNPLQEYFLGILVISELFILNFIKMVKNLVYGLVIYQSWKSRKL